MSLNADVGKLPWKKITLVFVGLLALAGAAFGGWVAYKKVSDKPLTPLESKALVAKYLEEKTGQKEFKCAVDISKEKNVWEALKFAYDAPPDYKDVYRSMGEHLSVAEKLLSSTEEKDRYNGLRVVLELTQIANEVAYDAWFGARIADAYLVPLFDKTEENPKRGISRDVLMYLTIRVYRVAEEDDKVLDWGKKYLAQYTSGPRVEEMRRRVGQVLQSKGQQKEAQMYFAQINRDASAKAERRTQRDAAHK